jgi:hypothetical protein
MPRNMKEKKFRRKNGHEHKLGTTGNQREVGGGSEGRM